MRHYDFTPLGRSLIGFDRMANLIDAATKLETAPGYPPYNIEQIDEQTYRIEIAVAGFAQSELELQSHNNVLSVSGRKDDNTERNFVHRGIAGRGFERRFQLADHVRVERADVANGLLVITLKREVPEALKPRVITIGQTLGTDSETGKSADAPANDKSLTPGSSSGKGKAA